MTERLPKWKVWWEVWRSKGSQGYTAAPTEYFVTEIDLKQARAALEKATRNSEIAKARATIRAMIASNDHT